MNSIPLMLNGANGNLSCHLLSWSCTQYSMLVVIFVVYKCFNHRIWVDVSKGSHLYFCLTHQDIAKKTAILNPTRIPEIPTFWVVFLHCSNSVFHQCYNPLLKLSGVSGHLIYCQSPAVIWLLIFFPILAPGLLC